MCAVFTLAALLVIFAPLIWAGGFSGWNETFMLCFTCLLVGLYLRWREHVILCLPFLFIGILGMVAFYFGWV